MRMKLELTDTPAIMQALGYASVKDIQTITGIKSRAGLYALLNQLPRTARRHLGRRMFYKLDRIIKLIKAGKS